MNTITKFTKTQYAIIEEIIKAAIDLGANSGLVANIASWGDTLSDEDTLQNLKDWNAKKFAKSKNSLQHQ